MGVVGTLVGGVSWVSGLAVGCRGEVVCAFVCPVGLDCLVGSDSVSWGAFAKGWSIRLLFLVWKLVCWSFDRSIGV